MEGWKDEFANLVHKLEAAGHARESARCWGTGLHDPVQSSIYRSPGLLIFWATWQGVEGHGT